MISRNVGAKLNKGSLRIRSWSETLENFEINEVRAVQASCEARKKKNASSAKKRCEIEGTRFRIGVPLKSLIFVSIVVILDKISTQNKKRYVDNGLA